MSYRIEFTPSAARAFKGLESPIQNRIAAKIEALGADPRPHRVEKLSGADDRYRIRVGSHRIIFEINDSARVATITVIGHRREVYR